MERLTIRTPSGAALKMKKHYLTESAAKRDLMQKYCVAMERLAAYEDTGLEPEEIGKWKEALSKLTNVTGDRIIEIANAESESCLVVLPCKVGDTVWSAEPFKDGKLREGSIVQISIDEDSVCGFWAGFDPEPVAAAFASEDIGKTVFLTCEEAQAALRKDAQNGR